ncbi:hypothetical protein [Mycobacterium palustre]|uniref:PPW family C-terminal domain-containing PPE protein n=2 Tax=Mycobacterium palustre TaxID=153971 RepID=UPI003FD78BA7
MGTYHAVAEECLATIPTISAAPQIVTRETTAADGSDPGDPTALIIQALQNVLTRLGDLATQYLSGPAGSLISQMLDSVVAFMSTQLFLIPAYSILDPLIYIGPFTPAVLPFLAPIGLVGLVGVAEAPTGEGATPLVQGESPEPRSPMVAPAPQITLAGKATGAPTTSGGAPATATPASAAPSGVPATQVFYAVGGGPDGEGFSPTSGTKGSAAPAASAVAPAAEMPGASQQIRDKRNARLLQRGHKYQFAHLDGDAPVLRPEDPAPDYGALASDSGSGPFGFGGTNPRIAAAKAKGLTRLAGGALDDLPRAPMLPRNWDTDRSP